MVNMRVGLKCVGRHYTAILNEQDALTTEHDIVNSLCHQPNALNAAIHFFIHQSFNVFDGLIQTARLRRHKRMDVTF